MATIRKRGDRYQVQVRRRGVAASRSFLVKADAERWGREQEIEVDRRGVLVAPLEGTLGELVERYLFEVTPTKLGARDEGCVLRAFLKEAISKRKLSELQPSDLSNYRDRRLKVVKSTTVRRQWNLLRGILSWGGVPIEVPPVRAQDTRVERRLQPLELEALVEASFETRNPYLLPCVLFALETGLRRGELLAARWQDLEGSTLRVPKTKTGHQRVVVLTERAKSLLDNLKGVRVGQIFPTSANALRLAWVRLCKRAGVKLRFHDLRHEAISHFFELGLTIPEVASQSGHRDLSILSRYAHPHAENILRKLN